MQLDQTKNEKEKLKIRPKLQETMFLLKDIKMLYERITLMDERYSEGFALTPSTSFRLLVPIYKFL